MGDEENETVEVLFRARFLPGFPYFVHMPGHRRWPKHPKPPPPSELRQVVLAWALHHGVAVIPASTRTERQRPKAQKQKSMRATARCAIELSLVGVGVFVS